MTNILKNLYNQFNFFNKYMQRSNNYNSIFWNAKHNLLEDISNSKSKWELIKANQPLFATFKNNLPILTSSTISEGTSGGTGTVVVPPVVVWYTYTDVPVAARSWSLPYNASYPNQLWHQSFTLNVTIPSKLSFTFNPLSTAQMAVSMGYCVGGATTNTGYLHGITVNSPVTEYSNGLWFQFFPISQTYTVTFIDGGIIKSRFYPSVLQTSTITIIEQVIGTFKVIITDTSNTIKFNQSFTTSSPSSSNYTSLKRLWHWGMYNDSPGTYMNSSIVPTPSIVDSLIV